MLIYNDTNIIFSILLGLIISYYYQPIFNKDFIIYLISLSIIFYILFSFLNVSIEKFNTDQPTWEQKFKNYNIIYQDQNKRHNLYKNLKDENEKNEICKLINDVKKEDLYNKLIELENEANEAKNKFNIKKSQLYVNNYTRLKNQILNLESKINCPESSSKNNTTTTLIPKSISYIQKEIQPELYEEEIQAKLYKEKIQSELYQEEIYSTMIEEEYNIPNNINEETYSTMTEEQYYSQSPKYSNIRNKQRRRGNDIYSQQINSTNRNQPLELNNEMNNKPYNMMNDIVNQEDYIKKSIKKEGDKKDKKKALDSDLNNNNDINIFINNTPENENKPLKNKEVIRNNSNKLIKNKPTSQMMTPKKYLNYNSNNNNIYPETPTNLYPQTLNNLMHEKKTMKTNTTCPIEINQPWTNYKTGDDDSNEKIVPQGYNI